MNALISIVLIVLFTALGYMSGREDGYIAVASGKIKCEPTYSFGNEPDYLCGKPNHGGDHER